MGHGKAWHYMEWHMLNILNGKYIPRSYKLHVQPIESFQSLEGKKAPEFLLFKV